MLTLNSKRLVTDNTYRIDGTCLSSDTKPTDDNISNGSTLLEMDTATLYMYDAENKTWRAWT